MVCQLIVCIVYRSTQTTYFTTLDISPDSSRAAIGDSTGSIVLLRIPTGEQVVVWRCDRGLYFDSLQFSPAGNCLAVGTAGKITDGHVTTPSPLHVWDVSSGDQLTRHLKVLFGSFDKEVAWDERPIIVNWLNSGYQVLIGSHQSLFAIDVLTKSTECKDLPSFQTFSRNGQFILSTASPNQSSLGTYFGDPMTFTEVGLSIPRHLPLAVSPDSTLVATLLLHDGSDGSNVISGPFNVFPCVCPSWGTLSSPYGLQLEYSRDEYGKIREFLGLGLRDLRTITDPAYFYGSGRTPWQAWSNVPYSEIKDPIALRPGCSLANCLAAFNIGMYVPAFGLGESACTVQGGKATCANRRFDRLQQ